MRAPAYSDAFEYVLSLNCPSKCSSPTIGNFKTGNLDSLNNATSPRGHYSPGSIIKLNYRTDTIARWVEDKRGPVGKLVSDLDEPD